MSAKLKNKSEEVFNMTTRGNYMIYKMVRKDPEDKVTLFFLPDDSLRRLLERHLELASMKEQGYLIMGIAYVDKATYLNQRLNNTVEEYLYMDREEQDVRFKLKFHEMDRDVAIKTLEMIQDHKWTLLKKLGSQVRRLIREDFDVENEIAIQLYDQYLKALL